jgi:hypothetical protein
MEADYFMLEGLRNPTSDIGSGETAVTSLVVDVGGDHYACPTGVHPREGPACYAYNPCRNALARKGGSQWVKPTKQLVTVITKLEMDETVLVNAEA